MTTSIIYRIVKSLKKIFNKDGKEKHMKNINRDAAIKKITEMPKEQVTKVLIFMAGMEAEHTILEKNVDILYETSNLDGKNNT